MGRQPDSQVAGVLLPYPALGRSACMVSTTAGNAAGTRCRRANAMRRCRVSPWSRTSPEFFASKQNLGVGSCPGFQTRKPALAARLPGPLQAGACRHVGQSAMGRHSIRRQAGISEPGRKKANPNKHEHQPAHILAGSGARNVTNHIQRQAGTLHTRPKATGSPFNGFFMPCPKALPVQLCEDLATGIPHSTCRPARQARRYTE